jgi:hypothetical protein
MLQKWCNFAGPLSRLRTGKVAIRNLRPDTLLIVTQILCVVLPENQRTAPEITI